MAEEQFVQLESVRVSPDGAAEMDGTRRLIFVPRAEIERLEVRHGSGSERPIVTGLLGAVLLILSGIPIRMFINALRGYGTFELKMITAVAFIFPATWLLDLSLRRRWMIVVHMRKGTRKLVFHETKDGAAIQSFLTDARSKFGYGG